MKRFFVRFLSELKDRFPFLDLGTRVVPQPKTSCLGRKSSLYVRVTQPNDSPDPKGSCMEYVRPVKEHYRFGNLAVASAVAAYVKRSFRHRERQKRSTKEESCWLQCGQFLCPYDRGCHESVLSVLRGATTNYPAR